jgi:NAD(P)-dependent dehydrogenase (short-subunit alcohol dehydrogenase family)
MNIDGAVALVTGAAAGTGRAIAFRLAAEGARVMVADVDLDGGADTAAAIEAAGGTARFVAADVTSRESVVEMVASCVRVYGGLDILVNNAGGAEKPPFPDTPVAELDRCLDLNLRGPLHAIQEALPAMAARGGGAIVNIASVGGTPGGPDNYPAYNAAKAGLIRLSETLRPACAARGISIASLAPGLILTDRVLSDLGGAPAPEDAVGPEDVAASLVELLR